MGVWDDRLQGGFLVCRAWLVFLTGCTSVYVFFHEFFHSSAFVCLTEEVGHVGDAGVSCVWVIVVQFQYFLPCIEFFGELNLGKACQW